jgi:hypothetical protein
LQLKEIITVFGVEFLDQLISGQGVIVVELRSRDFPTLSVQLSEIKCKSEKEQN